MRFPVRSPLLPLIALATWTTAAAAQDSREAAIPSIAHVDGRAGAAGSGAAAPSTQYAPSDADAAQARPADLIRTEAGAPERPALAPQRSGKVAAGFLKNDAALQSARLQPGRTRSAGPGAGEHAQKTAQIWNRYGGLLEVISRRLSVQPDAAVAVIAAESGGLAFVNGRPVVRFENHHFWKHWGESNPGVYGRHFRFNAGKEPWTGHAFRTSATEPWGPVHGQGQAREWTVYEFAVKLSRPDALRSASWGMAQIMGSNHQRIGYTSAAAMVTSFSDQSAGVHMQVFGLFDFVLGGKATSPALTAFQNRDWLTFATAYNGKKNAEVYAKRLGLFYAGAQSLTWN